MRRSFVLDLRLSQRVLLIPVLWKKIFFVIWWLGFHPPNQPKKVKVLISVFFFKGFRLRQSQTQHFLPFFHPYKRNQRSYWNEKSLFLKRKNRVWCSCARVRHFSDGSREASPKKGPEDLFLTHLPGAGPSPISNWKPGWTTKVLSSPGATGHEHPEPPALGQRVRGWGGQCRAVDDGGWRMLHALLLLRSPQCNPSAQMDAQSAKKSLSFQKSVKHCYYLKPTIQINEHWQKLW